MQKRFPILAACCLLSGSLSPARAAQELSPLSLHQGTIVDADRNPVTLRGCNLGNWLVLEMWMLDLADEALGDQHELEALLSRRFGDAERARLMELYREHWITGCRLRPVKSFGMNLVRLPFEYRLLEDDAEPFHLKPDAWRWLDRAVEMAEKHGIYVILDLHGAPGRQSAMDHTGRRDENQLWTDADTRPVPYGCGSRSPAGIAIARRWLPTIFSMSPGEAPEQLSSMVIRLFNAVREVDEETIVVLPGHYDGIDLYGDPRDNGWTTTSSPCIGTRGSSVGAGPHPMCTRTSSMAASRNGAERWRRWKPRCWSANSTWCISRRAAAR